MLSLRIVYVVGKEHKTHVLAIYPEGTKDVESKPEQESNHRKSLCLPGKVYL